SGHRLHRGRRSTSDRRSLKDATATSTCRKSWSHRPSSREDRGSGKGRDPWTLDGSENRCGGRGRHTRAASPPDLTSRSQCDKAGRPIPAAAGSLSLKTVGDLAKSGVQFRGPPRVLLELPAYLFELGPRILRACRGVCDFPG